MRYVAVLMVCLVLSVPGLARGAVPRNVKLTVTEPRGPADQGKDVRAEAVVARIAISEQLKQVALELLSHLQGVYPNSRTYTVVLSDDARMLAIGNYLAVATVKEGKTTVTGGIPTAMDIRVMRASHIEVRRPDERGLQVVYEVALQRKEAARKKQPVANDKMYARVAKKLKLTPLLVRQLDLGVTRYYKAFEGKSF